ncbi:IclR family transcriptional regulator [Occultella gossypii]|uniref:Helix-turn-helix domain-containing protein n=1 Tax=Occultella gossypii TaxID=2800820 RepID=A0ABS7S8U2_9MICO|nr:helix-turn-helix domain-containing protein [Occultella gossypii]MBZ2196773.1 helix-turn-helix domain-containing protein [Occultella gossypii]
MLPAQPNQSLIDGLACLHALAASPAALGSRELARLLEFEPTRTNRLLKTLAHLGLAEQDEKRKYRVGPAIHVLGVESLHTSGFIDRAVEVLKGLDGEHLTVAMGVLWQDVVCYLYHQYPSHTDGGTVRHRPVPASTSGLGLALMAQMSDDELRALYAVRSGAQRDGPTGLLEQVADARRQGYALFAAGGGERTIAIVLGGSLHAAIGVSGIFPDGDIPGLVSDLRSAAAQITETG